MSAKLTCRTVLVLFCVVDDHLHLVLQADPQRRGRIVKALFDALAAIAAAPMAPSRPLPVEDVSHLESLVPYLARQPVQHGLAEHPALWSGSCFLDLARARWIEGLVLLLFELLPRFRLRRAFEAVRLPQQPLVPAYVLLIRVLGAHRLVSAVAAALAVGPALQGLPRGVVLARRSVLAVGRQAGLPLDELSFALDLRPRSARRLAGRAPHPAIDAAVRRRLALEQVVAAEARSLQLVTLAASK